LRWRVEITVKEPLIIGSGQKSRNVQMTSEMIPGSVWRGSLSERILLALGLKNYDGCGRVKEKPPADFIDVFNGGMRFGFLYLVPPEKGISGETIPLPLTARTCKDSPGFAGEGHGVWDLLLWKLRKKLNEQVTGIGGCRYGSCGGRLERIRGYAWTSMDNDGSYQKVKIPKRLFHRTALDRNLETASDGYLYTMEALVPTSGKEEMVFAGDIWGSEEQYSKLEKLLEEFFISNDLGFEVRIGTGKSRGFGRGYFKIKEASEKKPLEDRFNDFQSALGFDDEFLYFSITLRSPTLVCDDLGVPVTNISRDVLARYLSVVPAGLEMIVEASTLEWGSYGGWSPAWGLPKPMVAALNPGSTLVYKVPKREREPAIEFLGLLEEKGLGEYCSAGWGSVVVCDPFHLIFDICRESDNR
jgi:CRISPR-associated protein Csx10